MKLLNESVFRIETLLIGLKMRSVASPKLVFMRPMHFNVPDLTAHGPLETSHDMIFLLVITFSLSMYNTCP